MNNLQNIIIDDTNYKNTDPALIKKFVKDKILRKKYLRFHVNKKYYNDKLLDDNNNLKKKFCEICNCYVVKMPTHNKSIKHMSNDLKRF